MAWNSRLIRSRLIATCLGFFVAIFSATVTSSFGDGAANGPQVEYISPDGTFASLSADHATAPQPNAVFVDRETITCSLKEGETTFIVALPKNARGDRLTFLNENAEACGELRIAVSNSPLPADSPKWTEVDGIVPFAHKRLFKLSMLGVETKFVRLSFRVDADGNKSARIAHPFQTPMLSADMTSNVGTVAVGHRELSFAAISVAPLPTTARK